MTIKEATTEETIVRFEKSQIREPRVLNEAYDYSTPVPFTRGMRVELPGYSLILISGTASVDERGKSIHVGDIKAQSWRTFENIEALLESEGADWHDVVRTTCYLRDMSRDYEPFNKVRQAFYLQRGLEPLPASTGIQVTLCREDLLVEIEAMAVVPPERKKK
jgi:enamine deaminase RidA (YjgF/YER057c/UK114 family)